MLNCELEIAKEPAYALKEPALFGNLFDQIAAIIAVDRDSNSFGFKEVPMRRRQVEGLAARYAVALFCRSLRLVILWLLCPVSIDEAVRLLIPYENLSIRMYRLTIIEPVNIFKQPLVSGEQDDIFG